MISLERSDPTAFCGIVIRGDRQLVSELNVTTVLSYVNALDLLPCVKVLAQTLESSSFFQLYIASQHTSVWAPDFNTLGLSEILHLDPIRHDEDLLREILLTMLMSPIAIEFPSLEELKSSVRIRGNIVRAARKTTLAFQTSAAERPQDCWVYDDEWGFVIRPGASLITALMKATQPEFSGGLFSFSCYRASEYVILLGIAQELQHCNPDLYLQLQSQWMRRPIKSGEFHDVFLHEQGSMETPLPPYFFVPGDRTWFRNPDEASADASGFEGSWVVYLGGGLFSNFWKYDQPYTLHAKCLEIYHWRDGLYRDEQGEERIDEAKVQALVERSFQDPCEVTRILALMKRYREPRGIYTAAGGCIDTTREFPRHVCPGTATLVLPSR